MKKNKLGYDKMAGAYRIISISNKILDAEYYEGGSGCIVLKYRGEAFYWREDAKLKDHMESLVQNISTMKKKISITENALKVLKKAKEKSELKMKKK